MFGTYNSAEVLLMTPAALINYLTEKMRMGDVSIIDALTEFCSENNVEIETVSKFLKSDKMLLHMIKEEASKLNLLKKETVDESNTIFDIIGE